MLNTLWIILLVFIVVALLLFCCCCCCFPLSSCFLRLSFIPLKIILFSKYSIAFQTLIYVPYMIYLFVKCNDFESCSFQLTLLGTFTVFIGISFFIHVIRISYESVLIISNVFFFTIFKKNIVKHGTIEKSEVPSESFKKPQKDIFKKTQ